MAFSPISFIASNYRDYKNDWLKAYEPGTTTPKIMAIDTTGTPTVSKFELNTDGFIKSAGGALVIPFIDGAYDLWLFPTEAEADASDTSNAIRLADNITGSFTESGFDLSLINDLSQAYDFSTVAEYKAFATKFPISKKISLADRSASFTVISGTASATGNGTIASNEVDQSISIIKTSPINAVGYGAKTTNTRAQNKSAIQEAYNSMTGGDTLTFNPSGVYPVEEVVFGKSDVTADLNRSTLLNNGTSWTLQISLDDAFTFRQKIHNGSIDNGATAGDVLKSGYGWSSCVFDLNLRQRNINAYILNATFGIGGGYDSNWSGGEWYSSNSQTVSPFKVVCTDTARFNENTFNVQRCYYSGTLPWFDVRCTVATNWNYHNKWENITFEVCNGGLIHQSGARGSEVNNIANWDPEGFAGGELQNDAIRLDSSGVGLGSANNIIRNYTRTAGHLGVGFYDIALGNADDTTFEQTASIGGAGVTHNLNGRRAIIQRHAGETFDNIGLTNVQISESTQFTTPKLIVNGESTLTGDVDCGAATRTKKFVMDGFGILTIAAGVVNVSRSNHTVETEAAAASDDLDTINNGEDGMLLTLRPANDSRTIVVKHATGNIRLDGLADFTMDSVRDSIVLQYVAALSEWHEWGGGNKNGS